MMNRKLLLVPVLLALGLAPQVQAQPYPTKTIRFLVGFPPGGTNDLVARILAQKVGEILGQQVAVDNRGGANTAIATEIAARAPADGHTILLNSTGHTTNPSLIKLNFDSIRDFAFITLAAQSVNVLVVHPSLPAKNVQELIALSKRRPGEINYGSSGVGTSVHLSGELFQFMTGVRWVHIPYKGGSASMPDLLAGQLQIYFGNLPTLYPQAQLGKLRALATTGSKRVPAAPDLPTVSEAGVPGFEVSTWYGVSAPAKTQRPVIDRLHQVFVQALQAPDTRDKLVSAGADPVGNTPEQYTAFIQNEITKWAKVIKAAGIKSE